MDESLLMRACSMDSHVFTRGTAPLLRHAGIVAAGWCYNDAMLGCGSSFRAGPADRPVSAAPFHGPGNASHSPPVRSSLRILLLVCRTPGPCLPSVLVGGGPYWLRELVLHRIRARLLGPTPMSTDCRGSSRRACASGEIDHLKVAGNPRQ